MAGRIANSWNLAKQTLAVLRGDKQLIVFPILSTAAALVIMASFAVPIALSIDWHAFQSHNQHVRDSQAFRTPLYYALAFGFYFANFFVVTFFNSALVACVMNRFKGQDSSVGAGLRAACARLPQILLWSAFAATIGMVLRAISERMGLIGKIVIALVGVVWTVATYFVVPVLVVEGVGPIEAVKRSVATIKKTWGESIITGLGMGALSTAMALIALAPVCFGAALAIATNSPYPLLIGGAISVMAMVLVALISSTLKVILQAALYRFAATGEVPAPYDAALLQQVFKQKKQKS
jgi:hypothetical protein